MRRNFYRSTVSRLTSVAPSPRADRDVVAFEDLGGEAETLPTSVIMLGYEFWHERFGGNPNVLGQLVELDYQPYQIVGVTPPGFHALLPGEGDFRTTVDLWTLSRMRFETMSRDAVFLRVVGRLKPTVSLSEAQAEASLFADRQQERFPLHREAGFDVSVR